MTDPSLTRQTPHGALLNLPEQPGGLYHAVVMRGGIAHAVTTLREEGGEVLVSGATFYGWVARAPYRAGKRATCISRSSGRLGSVRGRGIPVQYR